MKASLYRWLVLLFRGRARPWSILGIAALTLGGINLFATESIRRAGEQGAIRQLEETLDGGVQAVSRRYQGGDEAVVLLLSDPAVREALQQVLDSGKARADLGEVSRRIDATLRDAAWPFYWLIEPPGRILVAFSPEFVDFTIQPQYQVSNPDSTLSETLRTGRAVQFPLRSTRARAVDAAKGQPSIFTSACRRLGDAASGERPGIFCVANDPRVGLFADLRGLWLHETGDAWIVDGSGRLRSPSRHEPLLGNEGPDEPTEISGYLPRENSRLPDAEGRIHRADPDAPFVASVDALLTTRGDVPVALYRSATGRMVFGGARWLPEIGAGLVVEVDADELLAPTAYAVRWVEVLFGVAFLTLLALGVAHHVIRGKIDRAHAVLGGLFGAAPMAVAVYDAFGQPIRENRRWMEWREEGLTTSIADVLAQLHVQNGGRPVYGLTSVPLRFRDAAQRLRHLHVQVVPLEYDWTGELRTQGVLARDVTDVFDASRAEQQRREKLEVAVAERTRELAAARDAAEAAVKARELFLASVGHEIRTPIAAIIGQSRLSLGAATDARSAAGFTRVLRSGQHLLRLVNDILDFSVMRSGALKVAAAPYDVVALLGRVVDMARYEAQQRGLAFEVDIDPGVPGVLDGDVMRLEQVLVNLLNNAFKFTERGRVTLEVRVTPTPAGSAVVWSVEDTGVGIAEADHQRIFRPFLQVDSGSARGHGGAGLGLAIASGLVERMGGHLRLRSTIGSGSRFEVSLPLFGAASTVPRIDWGDARGLTATVVCSCRRQGTRLVRQLEAAGFRVVETDAGAVDVVVIGSGDESCVGEWRDRPGVGAVALVSALPLAPDNAGVLHIEAPVVPLATRALVSALRGGQDSALPHASAVLPRVSTPLGRALVVDDDDVSRDVMIRTLGAIGVDADGAKSGPHALELLSARRYAVAFLDFHMPGMDGATLARTLRAQSSLAHLRLIGCTASVLESEIASAAEAGIHEVISKPFSIEDLHRMLDRSPATAQAPSKWPAGDAVAEILGRAGLDFEIAVAALGGDRRVFLDIARRIADAGSLDPETLRDLLANGATLRAAERMHLAIAHAGRLGARDDLDTLRSAEAALRRDDVTDPTLARALSRLGRIVEALAEACGDPAPV